MLGDFLSILSVAVTNPKEVLVLGLKKIWLEDERVLVLFLRIVWNVSSPGCVSVFSYYIGTNKLGLACLWGTFSCELRRFISDKLFLKETVLVWVLSQVDLMGLEFDYLVWAEWLFILGLGVVEFCWFRLRSGCFLLKIWEVFNHFALVLLWILLAPWIVIALLVHERVFKGRGGCCGIIMGGCLISYEVIDHLIWEVIALSLVTEHVWYLLLVRSVWLQ